MQTVDVWKWNYKMRIKSRESHTTFKLKGSIWRILKPPSPLPKSRIISCKIHFPSTVKEAWGHETSGTHEFKGIDFDSITGPYSGGENYHKFGVKTSYFLVPEPIIDHTWTTGISVFPFLAHTIL